MEPAALTGKSRRAEVVRARQVAMYLCREIVRNSYAEIGLQFQRDHSTVMHACGKIADLLEEDEADVVAAVNSITERIELYGPD